MCPRSGLVQGTSECTLVPVSGRPRLRFGGGTVRAVPVFGSGGSSAKRRFCVSVQFNRKGTVPVPVSVPGKRFRRFRFRVRFLRKRFRRFRFPVPVRFLGHPAVLGTEEHPNVRKVPDTFTFLRHVMRAILYVRPKCSHRCVSLKETPLKPVQNLKHTTKDSTEQTAMRTKWFKTCRDLNCSGASPRMYPRAGFLVHSMGTSAKTTLFGNHPVLRPTPDKLQLCLYIYYRFGPHTLRP